jgi:pimeloyl-ACP methyl ester carboxylesterase
MGEGTEDATAITPPLGQFYEVRGRQLFTHRSGHGAPSVVFLPGGGAVGLDYWNVQAAAAERTTSIIYDRAGTGWSQRVDLPRRSAEVTDELRQLLRTMEVDGPHLLVGHSLGGLYARHFATRFPGEIAGLVLLDPAHEDYNTYMPEELVARWESWDPGQMLPDELPAELVQFYRALFGRELAGWPAAIREPLIAAHTSLPWLRVGFQEAGHVDQLYEEVRQAGSWPDVPTTILCSMEIDDFKRAVSAGPAESLLQAEIDGKKQLYDNLAKSIPHGKNVPVGGGHVTLHLRHPEAVTQAISELLAG